MARSCVRWALRIVFAIALIGGNSFSAEYWVRLSSPNFDLYSSLSKKRSTALLKRLENARLALAQLGIYASSNTQPIRVIAFRSQREYRPYSSDAGSTAFFLHSAQRDYIVIKADSDDVYTPAVHEYAHYVLHQQFHHLPRWLDEGLADVYSTVQEKDGIVRVGLPLDDRLELLRMDGLAYGLPTLFQLEQKTLVNMRNMMPRSRFYAESWMLAHMLRLSPAYSPKFNDFMREMEQGATAQQALWNAFQKSEADVQQDLQRYVEAEHIPTSVMQMKEAPADLSHQAYPIGPADSSATLDDLLSALGRSPEASSSRWGAAPGL
jgi:hypothetical protein